MQNLSSTRREILLALIDIYNKNKRMVKSKEIADMIGKDEGTVRNVILSLKVLGLIESKPGPSGGYVPTLKAYEAIKNPVITPLLSQLTLYKDGMETDIRINNIEILDITNPNGNKVLLKVSGDLRKIKVGDTVKIGPIPYTRLVIEGVIIHTDDERKELVIDVTRMVSIPKVQVKNIMGKRLVALKPENTLRDASQILYKEGIRGAPVLDNEGKNLGILTTADIIKAFFEQRYDAKVSDYMKTNVISISEDDDVLTAIKKMLIYNVGRLLVLNKDQRVIGIVTRTDILKTIAGLEEIITL